jgi:hypothetical protein
MVVAVVALTVVGVAGAGWAGIDHPDLCWRFDNFSTDYVQVDVKKADFDHKKVVTGFWRLIVCPGCTSTEHPNRVLMVGTIQSQIFDGPKGIALQGSLYDSTLNSPFARDCFLHLNFHNSTLSTGDVVGECRNYFDPFQDTVTKVSCSTLPNP